MKKLIFLSLLCALFMCARSQQSWTPLDNSPMDMIYYPVDYPILKIRKTAPETPLAKVVYSRPLKKSRKVFGELVEYGTVWRLGANEATEIDFFKDVRIAGTRVKKGRYTLYAIPQENKWTIILNKDTDVWGSFAYDVKKDVLRTDVKTETTKEPVEAFTMMFEKAGEGAKLLVAWEDVKVSIPITF